jgi:hypothetical protein
VIIRTSVVTVIEVCGTVTFDIALPCTPAWRVVRILRDIAGMSELSARYLNIGPVRLHYGEARLAS